MPKLIALSLTMLLVTACGSQQTSAPPTAAPIAASCSQIVKSALDTMAGRCNQVGSSQVCYGNAPIDAKTSKPDAVFKAPGDKIGLSDLQSLRTAPMDEKAGTWGIAVMRAPVNLPDTAVGQQVTFLMYGDTTLDSFSADMKTVTFRTGIGESGCSELPQSSLLIQVPHGQKTKLNINGTDVSLGSTAALQAQPNQEMLVSVLEGQAEVSAQGVSRVVPEGNRVHVPLQGQTASAPPSTPEPIPIQQVAAAPVQVLPEPLSATSVAVAINNAVQTATSQPPVSGNGSGNLLVNGNFQNGPNSGGFVTLSAGAKDIQGWEVSRATIDYIATIWQAPQGSKSIDLDGSPGFGGIKQTFATIPGQKYTVTFDMAGNPQGPPTIKTLQVEAAGQSGDFNFDVTGKSFTNMGWTNISWQFTANAASTTIEFYSTDAESGNYGPAIANVFISPQSAAGIPPTVRPTATRFPSSATNLIRNGSAEDPLVNGKIPGWVAAEGDQWTRTQVGNDFPAPAEGTWYFTCGQVAKAELYQDVDVSAFAQNIDAGKQRFVFNGYVRSYNQSPADTARIVVEYRDSTNGNVLSTYDSGETTSTAGWQLLSDAHVAPAGTRSIRIRLLTVRDNGSYNDGYFDALSLQAGSS